MSDITEILLKEGLQKRLVIISKDNTKMLNSLILAVWIPVLMFSCMGSTKVRNYHLGDEQVIHSQFTLI